MHFREKKIISLKFFDIEKFAFHFPKCPHPEKGLMLYIDIFSPSLMVIQACTLLQSEMKDPVVDEMHTICLN